MQEILDDSKEWIKVAQRKPTHKFWPRIKRNFDSEVSKVKKYELMNTQSFQYPSNTKRDNLNTITKVDDSTQQAVALNHRIDEVEPVSKEQALTFDIYTKDHYSTERKVSRRNINVSKADNDIEALKEKVKVSVSAMNQ